MLKKRYLAIAGLAVLAIAASGCGKKNTKEQTPVQVTPTETPQATPTVTIELVNMEETTEKNVIGEKTATASKVAIVNRTGSEIASIYIRETPSDDADEDTADEWGDDLVNGMFTLKNGENAVYYYEKPSSSGSTYDIRIAYTDEDANECFFRKLPLASMKQITLRMDGEGEDSIPYATYFTTTGSKEVSTLNEVKKRLGLDTDSEEDVTPTPDHLIQPIRRRHRMILITQPIRHRHQIRMITTITVITVTTEIIQVRQILRFGQRGIYWADHWMIWFQRLAIPIHQNMTKTRIMAQAVIIITETSRFQQL